MSVKSVLFKFWFGGGGGCSLAAPPTPWMCPCLSGTSVLDKATVYIDSLANEAVESPGECEKYLHINGFTLYWVCCLMSNMLPVIKQDQTEHVNPPTSPHWPLVWLWDVHSGRYIYDVHWNPRHSVQVVLKMLVCLPLNHLTWLVAWESFVVMSESCILMS